MCRVDQEYSKTRIKKTPQKLSKRQKLKNVLKYAKISDIPLNQRSLIHLEAWFPQCEGWTKNTKNTIFLNGKIIQNAKTQKLLEICQN